ncbi:MAG: hypothetical protein A2V64_00215 [Bacteroidetes bacterium RBG_13_43_22]|nr:MAG: hypothetical protein A2V64_00215 [Bacteroidetes bacterium RBG_13_43_22]
MKRILALSAGILLALNLLSQEASQSDTLRKDALNVFMEASDYIRKEIPYVNYVRDIKDAGVYIITTRQNTGSGGTEFTYFFVGQHEFAGMADTLKFVRQPDETQEETRQKEVNTLNMGLTRYVAKTPLSKYIKISFTEPLSETVTTDKWDNWVFRTSLNGFLNGEKSYNSTNLNGNINISRITDEIKINVRGRYNYSVDNYEIEGENYKSENNSKSVTGLIVKSISDHWSYGGTVFVGSSSYNNYELSYFFMPGIEYDVFPYSESTRRQLRLLYKAGFNHFSYIDTTVYDKLKENRWSHSLTAAYEVVQKWGSIDVALSYSNYMHDWSKNNISLEGFIDLRIAKGLSMNFGGGASIIHDQLSLVKGGATAEEVLLRRKELETQFNYFTMFGFTYTFGSIYNNVVNPRFGNTSGGGMTIMIN